MGTQDIIGAITGGLSQQDRLLKLDTSAGNNVLLPHRVTGCSRIGRDFSFLLDCVSTQGDVQLKTLIAQTVTLWIQQADRSYLPHHGYIHTARRLGADGNLTSYQLGFSSWMHFLKFRRDQRHWQDKAADEIVSDAFNQHPQAKGMYRFALSKPLPKRSYCRQDETDWNFVHRLLESEGLYGIWQQAADGKSHTLVITDRLETLEPLSPATVGFYRAGVSREADALTQWSGTRTLQSVLLSTRTFDYKSPPTPSSPKVRRYRRGRIKARCPRKPKSTNIPVAIRTRNRTGVISCRRFAWRNGSRRPSAFTAWVAYAPWTRAGASH